MHYNALKYAFFSYAPNISRIQDNVRTIGRCKKLFKIDTLATL